MGNVVFTPDAPPLTWVIKQELLRFPLFGWALAMLQPIAIDRKSSQAAANQILEQGKAYLDKGRWVLIFPEGTRIEPGQRGPLSVRRCAFIRSQRLPDITCCT